VQDSSDLPLLGHPAIDAIVDLWNSTTPRLNGIPTRQSFDPLTLKPWLGYFSIYETIDCGADFSIRLEGSYIVEMTGENWTGKRASVIDEKYGRSLVEDLRRVHNQRTYLLSRIHLFQRDFKSAIRALLPLTLGSGEVDQIFLCLYSESIRT
jgi:hypothetical protein